MGDCRIFFNGVAQGGTKNQSGGGGMGKIKCGDIKMAQQKCLDNVPFYK